MDVNCLEKNIIIDECKELIDLSIFLNAIDDGSIIAMGLIPYIGFVIKEAKKWIGSSNSFIMSGKYNYYITQLRLKNKYYTSDTKCNFDNQKKSLTEAINIEKDYYSAELNNVGVYLINEEYIGNTILYSDYLRIFRDTKKGLYESSEDILDLSIKMGGALCEIINLLEGKKYEFATSNIPLSEIKSEDMILDTCFFYKGDINKQVCFNILCSIDFILYVLTKICSVESTLLFRAKYLSIYHAVQDLKELKIFPNIESSLINKKFRNDMAHYGLFKYYDNTIYANLPFYGIVEERFGKSFYEMIPVLNNTMEIIQKTIKKELGLKI